MDFQPRRKKSDKEKKNREYNTYSAKHVRLTSNLLATVKPQKPPGTCQK